jgi:hypothetical protein
MSVIRRERQQQLEDYQPQETADQALLAFRRLKTGFRAPWKITAIQIKGLGRMIPPGRCNGEQARLSITSGARISVASGGYHGYGRRYIHKRIRTASVILNIEKQRADSVMRTLGLWNVPSRERHCPLGRCWTVRRWYFAWNWGNLQQHPLIIQAAADVGIDTAGAGTLFAGSSGLTDSGPTIFYLAGEEANNTSHTTYHQLLNSER